MKKLFGLTAGILFIFLFSVQGQSDYVPLKELFKNDFLVGAAVNNWAYSGEGAKTVLENYNTITGENSMKPQINYKK